MGLVELARSEALETKRPRPKPRPFGSERAATAGRSITPETYLQPALLFRGAEAICADNDVVQHHDSNQFPGFSQTFCDRPILCARRWISTRVVMRQDH